nr:hypothetical protein [Tanacetum cinerariifolium]
DVGHDLNKEGAANGQENHVEAGIVRIKDEVPSTIAEKDKGSEKKRKAFGGASCSNVPPKKLIIIGAGASTGGKYVVALQGLLERSTLPVEVGVTTMATLSFITSYVSLTPTQMDLFAFINHADPTKVRIGEGQTPLLKSTRGCVVPLANVNDQGNQNDDV